MIEGSFAVVVIVAVACMGLCAWLSPRALDWIATHADAQASALRKYHEVRREKTIDGVIARANDATSKVRRREY